MTGVQAPDTLGLAQAALRDRITTYLDVLGGTARMRAKGPAYLPKFAAEDDEAYQKRRAQAVLYNATELTLDALVGLVMKTDPALADNIPPEIAADWENIDFAGKHGVVFAREFFRETWGGTAAIFVDMQRVDPDAVRTKADERAAGLRPYWILIRPEQILRARPMEVNGATVMGVFAFEETVTVEDGPFGEREEKRVREYRRTPQGVQFTVWAQGRDEKDPEGWQEIESGIFPAVMDEVPIAWCSAGPAASFAAAEPALMDLAYENIDHYQQRSEHRKAWQYARVPVQVYPGMEPDDVVIAPDRGITTPTPEAKPYYMETSGAALGGSKDELLESERRMAMLGASMLYNANRGPQTATAEKIQKAESNSRLSSAARALQDTLEEAVRLHAKWRSLTLPTRTDGRWLTVNRDFEAYELDAREIAALNAAVAGGNLRLESFLAALRDGVPVLASLDPEAEAEALRQSGMAESAALLRAAREGSPPMREAA